MDAKPAFSWESLGKVMGHNLLIELRAVGAENLESLTIDSQEILKDSIEAAATGRADLLPELKAQARLLLADHGVEIAADTWTLVWQKVGVTLTFLAHAVAGIK